MNEHFTVARHKHLRLEVVKRCGCKKNKNLVKCKCHFSWQAQYLVKCKCHFSWQAQSLVKCKCHFSWQAQYAVNVCCLVCAHIVRNSGYNTLIVLRFASVLSSTELQHCKVLSKSQRYQVWSKPVRASIPMNSSSISQN